MKKRQVFAALVVAVFLTPIVLSIGVFVAVPLALVLVPVLLVLGMASLPAAIVALTRPEPAVAAVRTAEPGLVPGIAAAPSAIAAAR